MKLLTNASVISVFILGIIAAPLSFAQTNDGTESDNDNTNLAQQVSEFVHESRELFKQQKEETKEVISQCREDLRNAEPSERESAREKCRSNLEEIRESYKLVRETFREAFKEFGENMKVFIQESKGLPIDSNEKNAAIAEIDSLSDNSEKKELLKELQQKMDEETGEEKQKLREQEKEDRELVRDEQKAEWKAQKAQQKALRTHQKQDGKKVLLQVRDQLGEAIFSNCEITPDAGDIANVTTNPGGIARTQVSSDATSVDVECDVEGKTGSADSDLKKNGTTVIRVVIELPSPPPMPTT